MTVSERVFTSVPQLLEAENPILYVPTCVGFPDSTPVEVANDRPCGKAVVTAQVEAGEDEAVREYVNPWPAMAVAVMVDVMVGETHCCGAGPTAMIKIFVSRPQEF